MIKEMAAEQKALKQARKTGPYKATWKSGYYWVKGNDVPQNIKDSWSAANKVGQNSLRITAALNLYHELRGSDYRHAGWRGYSYDKAMEELRTIVKDADKSLGT